MTKPIVEVSFKTLEDFLQKYNLTDLLKKTKYLEHTKSIHKKFYALLVLHTHLKKITVWKRSKKRNQNFLDYLNETIADLSQSIFCFQHGSYKASYLILRSALENFIKTIGLLEDKNIILEIRVRTLIDKVEKQKLVSTNPIIQKHYNSIKGNYAILCKHVHTSDTTYMAKTTIVGVYPLFQEIKGKEVSTLIK